MSSITNSLKTGLVLWYDKNIDMGRLYVSGEPRDIHFTLGTRREIIVGIKTPRFGPEPPKELQVPQEGSQVIVAVRSWYEEKRYEDKVVLRRRVEVTGWNYLFLYRDAERRIAARPTYRVVQMMYWKGRPVSTQPERVIAEGSLDAVCAVTGKSSLPSRLMDFSYAYRTEKWNGSSWESTNEVDNYLSLPTAPTPAATVVHVSDTPRPAAPKTEKKPAAVKSFADLEVSVS